jgi:hypothetical protein
MGHKETHAVQQKRTLLDHLGGREKQRWRHGDAK